MIEGNKLQIKFGPVLAHWPRSVSLMVILAVLVGVVTACGDSTSTPAAATTGAAPIPPPTQAQTASTTISSATTNTVSSQNTTVASGTGQTIALYEDRTTPSNLVKAFYNAVNRKEYKRAYGYWQITGQPDTPASYDQFAKGYGDTAMVTFNLGQLTQEAGAGQLWAKIPTVLIARHTDGSQQTFAGCYLAHRVNTGVSTNPADELWGFRAGRLALATAGAQPDSGSCSALGGDRLAGTFNDQSSPESLVKSYYNAISVNDYERAYSYWENPGKGDPNTPGPFDQFAKGYQDTTSVYYSLGQITSDAGAGQLYASIPIVLTSTHTDGSRTIFAGCYIAHRVNNGASSNPADDRWRFRSGNLAVAAANAEPDAKSCIS